VDDGRERFLHSRYHIHGYCLQSKLEGWKKGGKITPEGPWEYLREGSVSAVH